MGASSTSFTHSRAAADSGLALGDRRGARWSVVALAVLIAAAVMVRHQAFFTLFMADDIAQIAMLEGRYPVERSPLNLFSLSDGSVEEGRKLIDVGYYPWWSDPEMRLSMLRPLASALIWLDHTLFGHAPLLYHVHSMLWWVAMLVLVAVLFHRLLPPTVAVLAFALLSLDEGHGVAVGWLANRCALISAVFSLLGFLSYLRFRQGAGVAAGEPAAFRWHVWTIAFWFALALAAGEYAVCIYGYVVAYECLCVRESFRTRVRRTWPIYAPAVAFVVLRGLLGVGIAKSAVYLDVTGHPLESAWMMMQRFPALVADLVLSVRGEYWTFGFPWTYQLVVNGWVGAEWLRSPEPFRVVHVAIGVGALALFAGLFFRLARTGRYRSAGFLALGSLLSLGPVLASFPSSRLLLLPLVGACPVLAAFVVEQFGGAVRGGLRRVGGIVGLLVAIVLLTIHGGWAAWSSYQHQALLRHDSEVITAADLHVRFDERDLEQKDVLILAAVEGGTSYYFRFVRQQYGRVAPKTARVLSLTAARHRLTRVADNGLVLSVLDGFRMVSSASDQLLHAAPVEFHVGQQIELTGMRVTVEEVVDALPTSIRVDLETSLDDPSLLLIYPTHQGFVEITPPRVGQFLELPGPMIPYY